MSAQPKSWEHARIACLVRDGYVCQICGKADANEADHIWPRSAGGPHTLENLQAACGPCNKRKGDKHNVNTATAEQLMWLLNHLRKIEQETADRVAVAVVRLANRYPTTTVEDLGLTLAMLSRQRWHGSGFGFIPRELLTETADEQRAFAEADYKQRIAECDAADRLAASMAEADHHLIRDHIVAECSEADDKS